jgi:hypothetical protein
MKVESELLVGFPVFVAHRVVQNEISGRFL